MWTLHSYLVRQVLATCLLTVATFTGILLLGNVLRDVFDMVASGRVDARTALEAILLLIPYALAFALPIGMLTGSLLVFSRLSVDQELTAIRAGGISIVAAVAPIILLAGVMTGLNAWLNMEVGPNCKQAFRRLHMEVARRGATAFIGEGRYVQLGNLTLYAREVRGNRLRDILIYGTTNSPAGSDGTAPKAIRNLDVWAPEGEVLMGTNGLPAAIRLLRLQGLFMTADGWQSHFNAEHIEPIRSLDSGGAWKPGLTIMSFRELLAELALRREGGSALSPVRVQIHKQLAFSFSCVAFTLIGIPLGIRVQRRETNIGVAVALALLAVYYSFFILGHSLDTRAHLHPHLLFWIPNFAFMAIGVVLLRRAEKPA